MFGSFSHIGYTLLFGAIPFCVLLIFYHKLLFKNATTIARTMFVLFIAGPIADAVAIKTRIWVFPLEKRLGIELLGYPVDELVFALFAGLIICLLTAIFLDLERRKANLSTWLKVIIGISSLAILTTLLMLILRLIIKPT